MNQELHIDDTDNVMRLGKLLRSRREALGWTAREVAQQAGVDKATVTRIELGQIPNPRADNLKVIAQALRIPASDLFAAAGWVPKDELPTLRPYLRTKYDLTPEEMKNIEAEFERIAREKGLSFHEYDGPLDGEDE